MYLIPEIETKGFSEKNLALLDAYYRNPCIGAYGLTESEACAVINHLLVSNCGLALTECVTDLIAVEYFAILVRANSATAEELTSLWGFCLDVDVSAKVIISIGSEGIPEALKPKIHVFPNFEALVPKLKYLLLDALRKDKKEKIFSNTLANAIQILCAIRSCPGITTRQLAEKTSISMRSVQRYIETLRVAGEWIEYDAKAKGWHLQHGISILLEDHLYSE